MSLHQRALSRSIRRRGSSTTPQPRIPPCSSADLERRPGPGQRRGAERHRLPQWFAADPLGSMWFQATAQFRTMRYSPGWRAGRTPASVCHSGSGPGSRGELHDGKSSSTCPWATRRSRSTTRNYYAPGANLTRWRQRSSLPPLVSAIELACATVAMIDDWPRHSSREVGWLPVIGIRPGRHRSRVPGDQRGETGNLVSGNHSITIVNGITCSITRDGDDRVQRAVRPEASLSGALAKITAARGVEGHFLEGATYPDRDPRWRLWPRAGTTGAARSPARRPRRTAVNEHQGEWADL